MMCADVTTLDFTIRYMLFAMQGQWASTCDVCAGNWDPRGTSWLTTLWTTVSSLRAKGKYRH